ncbi:MAG: mechanosensitive channel MscK [Alcanivorax sp.]|jgi:potassium efflux system protein|uniref:mechanosensitive channel MscK n=1 Tax=Alcanivorax TaxID=59753 RepID=UPI000C4D66AE|nr:mechanosensitive channel MscK [Alcanivorax jadensis]MBG31855.1 mechanosensitive channel MscK [Alcanivorax sp.]|tara:strand:- start:1336 stop:4704 length:3369 start_codon:yes stop_codon:yes gene_type:complete
MDRRLPLFLLIFLPVIAQAQIGGFSLPGVGDLEKQISGSEDTSSDGSANPDKKILQQTLELRREIDSNQQTIKDLETFARQASTQRARLNAELAKARQQQDKDWAAQYKDLALQALIERLTSRLDALEKNQSRLAEVNGELTRAQTLPEQAQNVISKAMERMDTIRSRLNEGTDENGEPLSEKQEQGLNTELRALETRIERYNQELTVVDKKQDVARLEQQLLRTEQATLEAQLDAVQPLIQQRRINQLEEMAKSPESSLPDSVLENKRIQNAKAENQALREQLASTSQAVNSLLRRAIDTKTQLDKARALSSTVNDQIRLLDGSLLLSRVLYQQQKRLPQTQSDMNLQKRISDARLEQFELEQKIQSLDNSPLPEQEKIKGELSPDLEQAFTILHRERRELYDQLNQELGRQLAILTRTQLNKEQLDKVSRSLHSIISEQTFWMPSTQPVSLEWLGKLPGHITQQLRDMPWKALWQGARELVTGKWGWLVLAAIPAIILMLLRPRLKKRIDTMNKDVGFLRRDSQLHTPLSLIYTVLISSPAPIALAVIAAGLWRQPSTITSVLGAALAQLALLWLVFEMLYRLLKNGGIAQRHFRWDNQQNQHMRRRLALTGLAFIPMTFIIAFGDQWPAQLSNDRLGLVIMVVSLIVVMISLPSVARSYPGRHYSRTMKGLSTGLCAAAPLILTVLIGIGYYYTSVRLSGHMIYSLYLVVLWILLDAVAVRGLAVAAQRLAYRRAVAQREAEQKSSDTSSAASEAVEVEEPQLDLKQVNQQSLRLIRLALIAGIGLLVYWVWADVFHAFSYTENIVLWETADAAGQASGTSPISLGDVMTALIIGAVTFLLASNLPGLLEVLVLSRMDLRQGTSYATTTLLSYVIVASGVIITFGALGLSWDKMQWLVAALGVGLGFGLQEIFANFISGIILLFERPIRIGDVITINNLDGTVSRIRIRATTLIDFDRKEILVPNKVFVTERLINWSLSDTVTRIIIKVGFAYGSDLQKCRDILMQAARENKRVLRDPEPVVFFLTFGASTLDHELRVHVNDIGDRLAATDELNRHIDALCKEHDIEIAFSQLDIHIRNGDGDKLCIEGEKKEKSIQQDDKGQAPKANDGEHNESNDPR